MIPRSVFVRQPSHKYLDRLLDAIDKNIEKARREGNGERERHWLAFQSGACAMNATEYMDGRIDARIKRGSEKR